MDTIKKKILVVEDDNALRSVLKDTLTNGGFEVLEAENGEEGVASALSNHPDLILLDVVMPVMDGLTALQKIRADSWGANVPVFVLTNSGDTDRMVAATEFKVYQYMVKAEVNISDLVRDIQKALLPASTQEKSLKGSFGVAPHQ